jgi:recombination protein RecA
MSMNAEVLERLQKAGLLSDQTLDLGNVPTGSYAFNKIISGDYQKGIPIGMITQIHGGASTAKTIFITHILIEAQKKGYYTILVDSENAYSPEFAKMLGIDAEKLGYSAPQTVEDCFYYMETIIKSIREVDKDTPIVIAYDSIAVSPSKAEFEAEDKKKYDGTNMDGANRAKITGACLRKINPVLREEKVALVVINQIRHKVGVIHGDPSTPAAGGNALEYYLGVNIKTIASGKKSKI